MKYENGNIILSQKENQLLVTITDNWDYEPLEAQHFVCAMHLLKQDLAYLLMQFQSSPDFSRHERDVRLNMSIMTQAIDQFRAKAVALARAAGEELVIE